MNHQKYFSYSFCYNRYKLWLAQWLFSDCVFINHFTCQRCMRKFIIFHLQNKLSPSHLLMLHLNPPSPLFSSLFRLYWKGNGAILRPSAFPWFIWPHSSNFNAGEKCKRNRWKNGNGLQRNEWAENLCTRANRAKDAIIFQRKRIEIFFFFSFFKNLLHFRIVCLNAGCKDLLVWKVWRVLNLHILKTNAHSFQLSKRISWR